MILLTGFEPFTTGQGLKLTHNPTADYAAEVANGVDQVTSAVLPVSYRATRRALQGHLRSLQPLMWVGLGYAPHRTTVDIETIALNIEHATGPDNDGDQPFMRTIVEGAPAAYRTRLDVNDATTLFADHGVEAFASVHAGAFLCNQVFYLGCHHCEQDLGLSMAAFIHVPPLDDPAPFTKALAALLKNMSKP